MLCTGAPEGTPAGLCSARGVRLASITTRLLLLESIAIEIVYAEVITATRYEAELIGVTIVFPRELLGVQAIARFVSPFHIGDLVASYPRWDIPPAVMVGLEPS